ncbi:2-succinyl-6-hydroxy-2,4-cyclohexadiene-1-carboxylate synthase [soil metagenome]
MRVLLHGFLGDPSVWDGIAAPTDRAIALPGHGGGPVGATWDANIDAIAAQLDGATTVVGYSLGARLAMGLLASHRIDRAILISGNPGVAPEERAARLVSDEAWARRFESEPLGDVVDAWEAQPLFASQKRVASERLAARRQRRLSHDPHQLARAMGAISVATMPDYRSVITAESTACIIGADDAKYVAIARALPARIIVIPGAGHDVLLEAPHAVRDALESIEW